MEKYAFNVPTNGLCVLCLTDNVSLKEQVSIQSLRSFLGLDYRKIFSITTKFLKESDNEEVDIKVTLCRACADLGNTFSSLFREMEGIKQKMSGCVQSMLEVMINAESNVIRTKRYKEKVTGVPISTSAAETAVGVILKTTIPYKFRIETIQKCVSHVEKTRMKNGVLALPAKKHKTEEERIEEALEFEPSHESCTEFNGEDEGIIDHLSDEDEEMKLDEDADPEELMMQYNLFPDKYATSGEPSSSQCSSGSNSTTEGLDSVEEQPDIKFEVTKITRGKGKNSDMKACFNKFNSRYECNICGKVVVSLKNFELHQRRHTGEKPFACPFCEQHFRDTSNLRSHTLRYHRTPLFSKFKSKTLTEDEFKNALDKLVLSIVQVNEGVGVLHQSHKCSLCRKDYTQKYAIEDHIVLRHYSVLSTGLAQIQNDIDSYSSEDIATFLAQLYESGETCNVCGLCGQGFESGFEVNNHMKVHVKVKVARSSESKSNRNGKSETSDSLIQLKMKCNFCSKYFEDLTALKRHKDLHQGNCANAASRESVYTCEHCGRSFCSYYSQRSHVLSFHRFEVFSKYLPPGTTAGEIETVIKRITGRYKKLPNGLFQCSLCRKEITQLRKLQTHMMVTHFDEVAMKLKVAISRLHEQMANNGNGELPTLDYFENANGDMPFEGGFSEREGYRDCNLRCGVDPDSNNFMLV